MYRILVIIEKKISYIVSQSQNIILKYNIPVLYDCFCTICSGMMIDNISKNNKLNFIKYGKINTALNSNQNQLNKLIKNI